MRLLDLSIISISPMPGGGFQWPVTIITTGAPLLADFMTGEGATTGAGDGGATKSFEADASDSTSAAARWFFGSCPLRVLGIQAVPAAKDDRMPHDFGVAGRRNGHPFL